MELRENWKEREHLLMKIDGHRNRSEYVHRTAHESARQTGTLTRLLTDTA